MTDLAKVASNWLGTAQPELEITDLAVYDGTSWISRYNIQLGDVRYTDRDFTFTSVPSELAGSDWIKTANNSTDNTTVSPIAEFTVNADADVYVAWDDRASLPSWLAGWIHTGLDITDSDTGSGDFSVYKKSYAAGSLVTLESTESSSNRSMYTVIVRPAGQ